MRSIVAQDAGQAAIDDAGDALDRQRRFGDVRGEDQLATPRTLEHGVLLLGGQVAVELQQRDVLRARTGHETFLALADFADAGQKDEAVARGQLEDRRHTFRDQIHERSAIEVRQIADIDREMCGPGFQSPGSCPGYAAMGSVASVADMTTIFSSGRTVC